MKPCVFVSTAIVSLHWKSGGCRPVLPLPPALHPWHSDCEIVVHNKLQMTALLGLVFLWQLCQLYHDLCVNSSRYMPQNDNIGRWPRDWSDKGKGRCNITPVTGDSLLLVLGVTRKTSDRSPGLLSVQLTLTPGLYPGPGVYAGPGFYQYTPSHQFSVYVPRKPF